MTNDNLKGIFTLVLTGVGYISYIWPAMHAAFNPITFWQKLVMFFTVDMLSLVLTLVVAAAFFEGVDKVYKALTN